VYSLSAIDLFASAMGAFMLITLILMPDYQKERIAEKDIVYLEELQGRTEAELNEMEVSMKDLLSELEVARSRHQQLESEQDTVVSELRVLRAEQQARVEEPPPAPTVEPKVLELEPDPKPVSFRLLGLKTNKTRILFLVDMNSYLGQHEELVQQTVLRSIDTLQSGYQYGILGFQELDSGPKYYRWPEGNTLAPVSRTSRTQAIRFLRSLSSDYRGASPLLGAFEQAFSYPADALILLSDGLPNPAYNDGLSPSRLVRSITLANTRSREIHTVTVGDYFKYSGTVEFMEALARANSGKFLALAK